MILQFTPAPSFFLCGTKIFAPNEKHISRFYPHSVLILMMDGVLKFREGGEEITLTTGEYYIQRNGVLQSGVPLDPDKLPIYFFVEFDGYYSENADGLTLRGRFQAKDLVAHMEHLEELYTSKRANRFHQHAVMLRIFSVLASGDMASKRGRTIAVNTLNYLQSHLSSPLRLDLIADKFGYSEDHIVRRFTAEYGMTPHKYLVDLRLEQSAWLLENTQISAQDVAESVGYTDFSSFWRAFRHRYGTSPGDYRKKNMKKAPKKEKGTPPSL